MLGWTRKKDKQISKHIKGKRGKVTGKVATRRRRNRLARLSRRINRK